MSNSSPKYQWRFNHYIALFFIVAIFVFVNIIGLKKYYKADFTLNKYTELSGQTLNILHHLPGDVKITMVTSVGLDEVSGLIIDDVKNLLQEYSYKSNGKVTLRQLNLFTDPDAIQDLAQKFKLSAKENAIVIEYGDRNKILKVSDLGEFDTSGAMFGRPVKILAFKGEEVVSGAIVSLTQGKKAKIYFLSGHGEMDPSVPENDIEGASILAARIRSQNAEVKKLNLMESGQIPEDSSMLVILGPKVPYTPSEVAILKGYLENNGKLFILLNPRYASGLERFLEQPYGVRFSQDIILRKVVYLTNTGGGKLDVSADASGKAPVSSHPAIEWLNKVGANLSLGLAQSITISPTDDNKHYGIAPLIITDSSSWGETDLRDIDTKAPTFDPATDHRGPLNLVVAIDTGAVEGGKVDLGGTRIVVVGASQFLANKELGAFQADFFLNSMNWLLDQKQALGITPKVPKEFTVKINDQQMQALTMVVIVVFAAGFVIGAMVWFRRRK